MRLHTESLLLCLRLRTLYVIAFALCMLVTMTMHAQTPVGPIPQNYIGVIINQPNTVAQPTNSYGALRIWDSGPSASLPGVPGSQWPSINTSSGVYNFGSDSTGGLDHLLNQAFMANPNIVGFYTLNRTPNWASSSPGDTACAYYVAGGTLPNQLSGQCHPPSDLMTNGAGTDLIWKNWVTAIVTHVNDTTYLHTHIPIKYWEIWNEFDVRSGKVSYSGTYAQIVRMAEDARCIIKGSSAIAWIHNAGGAGVAQPCTAAGIDPTAEIVMPSAHDNAAAFKIVNNFLYCSGGAMNGSPDFCNQANGTHGDPRAGADAVDIINFHMKPGNENNPPLPETEMLKEYNDIEVNTAAMGGLALQTPDKSPTKPLWNGESGYSGNTSTCDPNPGWCGSNGAPNIASDAAAQVAFIGRFNVYQWSLGIQNSSWYTLDGDNTLTPTNLMAYQQTYKWLVDPSATTTMTTCTTATGKGGGQTLYSCALLDGTGSSPWKGTVMWDTSCATTGCGTNFTPPCNMLFYSTLDTTTETSIPTCPSSRVLNNVIGLKPVLFENKTLANKP